MTRANANHQGSLFPDLMPRLCAERTSPRMMVTLGPPPGLDAPNYWQLGLFDAVVARRSSIGYAIRRGDFVEALRLRNEIAEEHGDADVPPHLEYLEALAACDWSSLESALRTWSIAQPFLARRATRRRVADAWLGRLMGMASPADIIAADDSCLEELLNVLLSHDHEELASSLLRDALLRGREVLPRSLDDDALSDVLAEDLAPRWLASFGALRHAWPAPRPDAEGMASLQAALTLSPPESDDGRAVQFWRCLCVAGLLATGTRTLVFEARMRMRILHPELHALFMERLGG